MNRHKKLTSNRGGIRIIDRNKHKRNRDGFTIIELLIVVIVIAILAAITLVAYNGITGNAKRSALKSDLEGAVKMLQMKTSEDGEYPEDPTFKTSGDAVILYDYAPHTFCVMATTPSLEGVSFYATENGRIEEGECDVPRSSIISIIPNANYSIIDIRFSTRPSYEAVRVQVSKNSSFSALVENSLITPTWGSGGDTSYYTVGFSGSNNGYYDPGVYYVRVQAQGVGGRFAEWSDVEQITVP